MLRRLVLLLCAGLLAPAVLAQPLPKTVLSVGMYRIDAEVAGDNASRMTGLMNRRSMAPQAGMLFVFDQTQIHCMWMKNTFIPLSVAFLDDEGRILNIEDMQPHTETSHCASKPARYALEMNLGWFRGKGIGAGAMIGGLPRR